MSTTHELEDRLTKETNNMTVVRPCTHPRCEDRDGNPRLTTNSMCDPCRRRLHRELGWLIDDYHRVKNGMLNPIPSGAPRNSDSFGHPAQWASDTCRDIAGLLNHIEAELRTHVGDQPAPPENANERAILDHATTYLSARFHDLCDWPNVTPHIEAIRDTHHTIRRALGETRFRQSLPLPCPTCDKVTLVRYVGQIECESCSRVISEDDYPFLARIAVDNGINDAIDAYEQKHATPADAT